MGDRRFGHPGSRKALKTDGKTPETVMVPGVLLVGGSVFICEKQASMKVPATFPTKGTTPGRSAKCRRAEFHPHPREGSDAFSIPKLP